MIRGTTRLAAVIGWPIEHSRSPQLLNAAFAAAGIDAVLVPLAVPPEQLANALDGLRACRALGASITVPHKLAAAALADELTLPAREIGAVNCLQLVADRLVGHNTDCDGFVDGLRAAGFRPEAGPHVVLLGAGGAARAIAYGLRESCSIEVLARHPDQVDWAHGSTRATAWTDDNLRAAFARAGLVVDCTPIGLGGADEATFVDALPLEVLRPEAWAATLVYHRPTIWLARARARGLATVDGRAMLVHQGARAFAIWTGMPAPIAAMTQALDAAVAGT
ncbi:MAG: shikimate 5-dehydrogenase [Deltaproteobacteria bacterium]|nr:shikimate 5-dehydrogenase [Deltaproteobacteria bacterium]